MEIIKRPDSKTPAKPLPKAWQKIFTLSLGKLSLVISLGVALNWTLWYDSPSKCEGEKAYHLFSLQVREKTFEDGLVMKALGLFVWLFFLQVCPVWKATK